jgi:hypothetical protein
VPPVVGRAIEKSPPASSARPTQIGQAVSSHLGWDPYPVVDNIDAQVVAYRDVHGEGCCAAVPNGVAHRFTHHSFRVIGQRRIDHRQRSCVLHRGAEIRR